MDWPVHKPVCQIPPIIDIGAWIRVSSNPLAAASTLLSTIKSNRWLFKWACYEALGRNGQNLTLTHGLVISLIRTDRLVGPTPCHFFVHEIKVGQMADGGGPPVPDKRTAEIMRTGGLGTTAIKFTVSGGGMKMFRNDMLELTEPLSSAPPVPGWQNFVKAVANGEVASSDFLGMLDDARLENGEGSASFDELEQRVADMHV